MMFSQCREHRDKKEMLCHFSAALSGETMELVAQKSRPVLRGERDIPPGGPTSAAAWLRGQIPHANQGGEDICSMTQ